MTDATLPVVAVLLVAAGLSLRVLVHAALRVRSGQPPVDAVDQPLPEVPWMSCLLTMSIILLSAISMSSVAAEPKPPMTVAMTRNLCLQSIIICLVILTPLTVHGLRALADLGFHLHDWRRQVRDGAIGFVASILPVMLCLLATIHWRRPDSTHQLLQLLTSDRSPSTLMWIVLLAVVLAPLLEELMYRVVLQTSLQHALTPRLTLITIAFMFSAVHGLPDAVPLVPLAVILGYYYQQRRSFITVVVIHALFNAANLLLVAISL